MSVMTKAVVRVLLAVLFAGVRLYGAPETHVIIMHTNDIYGRLLPGPDSPGSARLATVVREVKPDLMLDAGNMFEAPQGVVDGQKLTNVRLYVNDTSSPY